jgi:hypothetical protein
MKARVQKLKGIMMSGKWGVVEGVIVTPDAAAIVLAFARNIELGLMDLRKLCKKYA